MASVLHKTRDPVDYRSSVSTPNFPTSEWFVNPDVSAVAGVPTKYWARPLADPVVEMTQAEKDAVDAAEKTAAEESAKAEAIALIRGADPVLYKALVAIMVVVKRELRAIKQNNARAEKTIKQLAAEAIAAIEKGDTE